MNKQGYTGNWRTNPITVILDQNELSKVNFDYEIEKMFDEAGLTFSFLSLVQSFCLA
ncbi:hypothetical protein ABEO83_22140 [Bacillus glycinifermentans]|uniref:hypothetical protein n=1 Tax=Bacillus glycinifermentans TaxID=1664069 RepID=UPI001581E5CA|nr:hypothetical protein [Bacillus glycinifermentans]MEC3608753.1 hypothetical protein [Bacillus glycinifermentans]UOY88021.1 hypothetical protein MW696_18630 [Bacillus glycinifermentans]